MTGPFDIGIVVISVVFVGYLAVSDKAAVRCIVFDKPQIGKVFYDIGIAVGAPFLLGPPIQ